MSTAASVDPSCFVQIASLALESDAPTRFYRDLLACIAQASDAFFASIHVRLPAETVNKDWCRETTSADFWRPAGREFLTEALAGANPKGRLYRSGAGVTVAGLSAPLRCESGERIGAICILVPSQGEELEGRLAMLNALVEFASNSYTPPVMRRPEPKAAERSTEAGGASSDAMGKALKNAGGYGSAMELAYTIVNQLQSKSGCQQVAIGRVSRGAAKVLAISGFDEVKKRSPGVIQVQQAMEECFDHEDTIVYQQQGADADDEQGQADFRLHRQWHEGAGGDAVACLPLRVDDKVRYVISLRRAKLTPFSGEEIEKFQALVEPYAMALSLLETATRSVWSHALSSVSRGVSSLTSPGGWFSKVVTASLLVGAIWFCVGTLPYRVAAPLLVVPTEVRAFDAPETITLRKSYVVEGDRIEEGQILCELDDSELLLEKQKLNAQIAGQRIEELNALGEDDRVTARMAQTQQEQLRNELAIVEQRLAQLVVVAPFDGTVISGDLRERQGDLLQKGEPLFEVAPDGRWRLDVNIPEADLVGIEAGQAGSFVTFANPEIEHELVVTRVAPSASQYKGRNVFVVEAQTDSDLEWVRPGMEGAAKVDVGDRAVWWITFHKAIDFFRVHFWF